MNEANKQTALSKAIEVIEDRVQAIGFTHISPESLEALGAQLEDESENVCRAYRTVMRGFQALFAEAA